MIPRIPKSQRFCGLPTDRGYVTAHTQYLSRGPGLCLDPRPARILNLDQKVRILLADSFPLIQHSPISWVAERTRLSWSLVTTCLHREVWTLFESTDGDSDLTIIRSFYTNDVLNYQGRLLESVITRYVHLKKQRCLIKDGWSFDCTSVSITNSGTTHAS